MENKELLRMFKNEFKGLSEKDKIKMILSNAIDIGSEKYGGMISGEQFDELSDTIIEFYKWKCGGNDNDEYYN